VCVCVCVCLCVCVCVYAAAHDGADDAHPYDLNIVFILEICFIAPQWKILSEREREREREKGGIFVSDM
jgi:hypothetical protein